MLDDFCSSDFHSNKSIQNPFMLLNSIDINGLLLCCLSVPSLIIRSHYTHSSPSFMLRTKVQRESTIFHFSISVLCCSLCSLHSASTPKIQINNKEKKIQTKKKKKKHQNYLKSHDVQRKIQNEVSEIVESRNLY